MERAVYNRNSSGEERGMKKLFSASLAVIAAVVLTPASATAEPPDGSPIDITGIELAGSSGVGDFDVFGTIRCESAGMVLIDARVTEDITDLAIGANNGLECASAGDTIPWVVTASGGSFVPGEKVHITADVAGAANGTDEEDHTLRHGS
jgi:hypothetical protein